MCFIAIFLFIGENPGLLLLFSIYSCKTCFTTCSLLWHFCKTRYSQLNMKKKFAYWRHAPDKIHPVSTNQAAQRGKEMFVMLKPCKTQEKAKIWPSSKNASRMPDELQFTSAPVMVSGRYIINQNGPLPPQPILIEHCCLMVKGNVWDISIKCRPHSNQRKKNENWINIKEVYPDAKVERKRNDIQLTLPLLRENLELAAFGVPGKDDQKRMQMAIFGKDPTKGCDWKIRIYLIDDSEMALKICKKGEDSGIKLLTTLSSLFVSNSKQDISMKFIHLEAGWQIVGDEVKTIASRDAWNSPENATDFPYCDFVVRHADMTKQQFFCRIRATHENDTADNEVVAFFQKDNDSKINKPTEKKHKKTFQMNCSKESNAAG
ncbi:uncharacterized protein LOC111325810 isoform X2 [Stylophora pistillata]|uniref:uncharacterized protein LOC111325810 isoform X2 n=1 Tax=Stylophora pistillata TaxID=50429 RepID=UPI000C03BC99|nr:uncharacterized protein LOC111325810 isoform X2 [Stylophora pistillata]